MNRIQVIITSLLALLFLLPTSVRAEVIDRIAARVNGEVITQYEVEEATTPYLMTRQQDPSILEDPEQRREIHRNVLDHLIEQELVMQEAKRLNLDVSERRIDEYIDRIKKQFGLSEARFKDVLKKRGMTFEEYRTKVRKQLIKTNFIQTKVGRNVSVSEEEVNKAYQEQFGAPSANKETYYTVYQILFQPEEETKQGWDQAKKHAQKALKMYRDGESFSTLAKNFSDGPNAQQGGKLGSFRKGQLHESINKTVFSLKEGEVSEVIQTKFGFHILKVTSIGQRATATEEDRRAKIRNMLRQQKLQEEAKKYVDEMRDEAYIEIKW